MVVGREISTLGHPAPTRPYVPKKYYFFVGERVVMSENRKEGSFIKTLMAIIGVVICLAALATTVAIFAKKCKKKISSITTEDSEDDFESEDNSCEVDCEDSGEQTEVDCEFAE